MMRMKKSNQNSSSVPTDRRPFDQYDVEAPHHTDLSASSLVALGHHNLSSLLPYRHCHHVFPHSRKCLLHVLVAAVVATIPPSFHTFYFVLICIHAHAHNLFIRIMMLHTLTPLTLTPILLLLPPNNHRPFVALSNRSVIASWYDEHPRKRKRRLESFCPRTLPRTPTRDQSWPLVRVKRT